MLEKQKNKKAVDEKSWLIKVEMNSEECPERFKKWNPPKNGYFCKISNKRCSKTNCKKRA